MAQRGDKRALAETVKRNAQEALTQHKLKRAGDFTARSAALQSIQEALGLADAPLRIECVDISHVQGTDVVASLVVFEDGLPRKSDYRHYAIREAAGEGRSDDVASIAEVTRRRFHAPPARYRRSPATWLMRLASIPSPPEQARRRFAYPPNLFVVDGGAPQVNAAAAVLDELGVTDVAVIGLAKRLEEVWVPAEPDPVIMPRNSEGLYLLQRVRDEAHRFAITYHRSKRSKRMTASALDSVRGLGEHRRKALVTHFGSLARLQAGQRRGDHRGARHRRGDGRGRCWRRSALSADSGAIRTRPPRLSAMIRRTGIGMTEQQGHARGTAWAGRQRRRRVGRGIGHRRRAGHRSVRAQAAAPRPRCSRTSAGTSPTTCRPN